MRSSAAPRKVRRGHMVLRESSKKIKVTTEQFSQVHVRKKKLSLHLICPTECQNSRLLGTILQMGRYHRHHSPSRQPSIRPQFSSCVSWILHSKQKCSCLKLSCIQLKWYHMVPAPTTTPKRESVQITLHSTVHQHQFSGQKYIFWIFYFFNHVLRREKLSDT